MTAFFCSCSLVTISTIVAASLLSSKRRHEGKFSSLGYDSCAPRFRTDILATPHAIEAARSKSTPRERYAAKAPQNASPAPTASTTGRDLHGSVEGSLIMMVSRSPSRDDAVLSSTELSVLPDDLRTIIAPRAPNVTITACLTPLSNNDLAIASSPSPVTSPSTSSKPHNEANSLSFGMRMSMEDNQSLDISHPLGAGAGFRIVIAPNRDDVFNASCAVSGVISS
mmetsp:Transcript_9248/g.20570  ORF Transcript_9248/g.20570 Transcript_9248/m.20570 type:complete len:225 (+) Transcript_9248:653-1327(+)